VAAKPDSFFDLLDTLVFHHDSPFTDTSAYPTYYAGKLARQFTDVILTGDGPDQTIGGSGHHVFAIKNNIFRSRNALARGFFRLSADLLSIFSFDPKPTLISKMRRNLYRRSLSPITAAYDLRSFFPNIVKRYICSPDLWKIHDENNPFRHPESWFREAKGVSDINKYLFADIKFYVPDDLMIKVDRMTMAHGLETLSPFQDIKLAQSVNRLPGSFKVRVTEDNRIITKYILKEICKKRFPERILNKKKQGFGIPLEKWLRQDNGSRLREVLFDRVALNRGYFDKQKVIRFVNDFINQKSDYFYPSAGGIVALLTLELWNRKYLDNSV
jgi:asparagine synthase (glutamine-hydrolysing)